MKLHELIADSIGEPKWLPFCIYGNFTDPDTGKNFFIFRAAGPRPKFQRVIVPAINKLVRSWFTAAQIDRDAYLRKNGKERLIQWHIESEHADIWTIKQPVSRFQWSPSGGFEKVDQ